MSIYLKLEDIEGDVTSAGYEDHIKLESVAFDVTRDQQYTGQLRFSSAKLSNFTLTKLIDISSASLLKNSVSGNPFQKMNIKFTRDIGTKILTYMEYELTQDCSIINYSLSAENKNEPLETITFDYSKIKYTYFIFDMTGRQINKQIITYDRDKSAVG